MHKALYPRDDVGWLCVSRKAFKIALMHWYKDSMTTLKNAEEDWLQWPEIIQTSQVLTK